MKKYKINIQVKKFMKKTLKKQVKLDKLSQKISTQICPRCTCNSLRLEFNVTQNSYMVYCSSCFLYESIKHFMQNNNK